MTDPRYPAGWDEARVRRVLAHYESQSPEEAIAEDEAAYEAPSGPPTHTAVDVPVELVPAIRELIARGARELKPAPATPNETL